MAKKETLKVDNERIEHAKKRLAIALNLIQSTTQELKWACKNQDWNDEVIYDIEEAALKLGYALGTLYVWNDDIPLLTNTEAV